MFYEMMQNSFLWRWFSRRIMPFLNFHIWGYPAYDMEKYFNIRYLLRYSPDKIFCFVGVDHTALSYLMNKVVAGVKWSHAGFLYLDENKEVRIWHMIHSGFEDQSLLAYLKEVDEFEVHMLPIPDDKKAIAEKRLKKLVGHRKNIKYDFSFELAEGFVKKLDSDEPINHYPDIYCSELVYIVGMGLVTDRMFQPHWSMQRKVFQPDDVAKSCPKCLD